MKRWFILPVAVLLLLAPWAASAEPFDTHHRIVFGPGLHSFFPENDEMEGMKPDEDGIVTEDEWAYIFDKGYDISDYNGLTFEVGYEYLFFHWFGLATNIGGYGGNKGYNFQIEGIEVQTDVNVFVFHVDVMPRFHWQTRWTDLFGGPVLGLYRATVNFDVEATIPALEDAKFHETEHDQDTSLGWGLDLGFEFRISEHWGVVLEDRLTSAVMFQDKARTEWFNAGGNVLFLACVVHL